MKLIPLTKGFNAIVDDCDYDELMKYKWFADVRGRGVYAKRHRSVSEGEKPGNIYMHRQMFPDLTSKICVDHINRNPLDNRRENIRICTVAENSRNSISWRENKSGYKGIMERPSGRFGSYISFNYKSICIGTFDTIEQAALAYDQKAKELFGEFAKLNFPENE